jgi:hypothetical protein
MKFNIRHLGVEQNVKLRWLWGITNAAELLRIGALQVGESITLHRNRTQLIPSERFHVRRVA